MNKIALLLICISFICSIQSSHSDDADMAAQWAVELTPGANPEEIARNLGFEYEGKHPTLPNIHLFRLQTQHRTRDLHPLKIADLQTHREVVWSEAQLPKERTKRERL